MCVILGAAAAAALAGGASATAAGMTTAAIASAAIAGAASGAQAGSNYESAKYQGQVAKQNADILRKQADNERLSGSVEAQKNTIKTRQDTSRAAVEMAGRGLNISTGSAANLLAQNEETGALDSLTILNNANRKALSYEQEAVNALNQAKINKRSAKWGIGTSILGSAASPVIGAI